MGRTTLPADAGMVFVFSEDSPRPFWMKDTLIPLSIAFYAGDGRILRILDMEPCDADPCPLYDPEVVVPRRARGQPGRVRGLGRLGGRPAADNLSLTGQTTREDA